MSQRQRCSFSFWWLLARLGFWFWAAKLRHLPQACFHHLAPHAVSFCVSAWIFPSLCKRTYSWTRVHLNSVWPHLNLFLPTKTRFPNKVILQSSRWAKTEGTCFDPALCWLSNCTTFCSVFEGSSCFTSSPILHSVIEMCFEISVICVCGCWWWWFHLGFNF